MIRLVDVYCYLLLFTVAGALLLSLVTLVICAVGRRTYPRAPQAWLKQAKKRLCLTWILGPLFVFLSIGCIRLLSGSFGAPMGDVVLTSKHPGLEGGVEVTFVWNDALYMTGMDMEWWATFYVVRDGKRIERQFGPAILDSWETALTREQIADTLGSLDIDTTQPEVVEQIDQLKKFFGRLAEYGLIVDDLTAFECRGPSGVIPEMDDRLPTNLVMGWLGVWAGGYIFAIRRGCGKDELRPDSAVALSLSPNGLSAANT